MVVKRLKGMKSLFYKLLYNHGNLHERVNKIRIELNEAQNVIDRDPSSSILHEDHAHYLFTIKEAQLNKERFLKQKSKVEWLKAGDANSCFSLVKDVFHEGVLVWPQDLIVRYPILTSVAGHLSLISHDQLEWRDSLGTVKPFSVNTVWRRVKDLASLSNLAPSLDLIISAIIPIAKRRTTRSVIAKLVVAASAYFIWQERNSHLFKKSKRSEDQLVESYFHKIVKSKCARYRIEMVSYSSNIFYDGNQVPGAFVNHYNQFLGAEGVTNPLDDHDLFIRVLDNSKADWLRALTDLLLLSLRKLRMWMAILLVLLGIFFSNGLGDIVSINQSAFVPGRRISDNSLLTQDPMRNYHRRRGPPRIINLCFADALFLFVCGHPSSIYLIMDALEEFKQVSGIVPSIPKSTAFLCNVSNAIKASILNSMPFAEGALSVRYLGVPLISSRLLCSDYKILVEKLESWVNDWRNKFLSLAGRLQLIRFVLSSMHIYWASIFILLFCIVHDLEQLMHGFLWCQGEMNKRKAKVAWESVCLLKHEGGLGIRRIKDYNIALMATHIWSILTHMESLLVKWVHTYKLKGHRFWDVPCRGDVSWGWRKLLQIRSKIISFIWHKINNGFSLDNSVSNLITDGVWRPLDWLPRFPFMAQLHVPLLLDDMDDVILWWDRTGVLSPFLMACVWDTIRSRADMQKLKTQDRLRQWDVGLSIDLNLLKCPLCDLVPDSHDHLFFEWSFSSRVWSKVRVLYCMDAISPRLVDIVAFIIPISKGKTVHIFTGVTLYPKQ
nr:hypothetical protein [Tanacetum cinerariifolium]